MAGDNFHHSRPNNSLISFNSSTTASSSLTAGNQIRGFGQVAGVVQCIVFEPFEVEFVKPRSLISQYENARNRPSAPWSSRVHQLFGLSP